MHELGVIFYVVRDVKKVAEENNVKKVSAVTLEIGEVTGITFLILGIYSFFWIRIKMKMPVFKSVPIQKVMAMENSMYYTIRKRRGLWR